MQLSLTYYSLGVTILFSKFWFENDTLIEVRYCHLLGVWCVFIVDLLFSPFFWFCSLVRYMLIYIKKYSGVFSFIYTSDLIIRLLEMFRVYSSCISNTKNIEGNIYSKEVSVVNTELNLKVKRVMFLTFSIDLV